MQQGLCPRANGQGRCSKMITLAWVLSVAVVYCFVNSAPVSAQPPGVVIGNSSGPIPPGSPPVVMGPDGKPIVDPNAKPRDSGIKVNAVCPGYVDTDMVAGAIERIMKRSGITAVQALEMIIRDSGQKRLATVDEVAEAVLAYALPTCAVTGEHSMVMGEVT